MLKLETIMNALQDRNLSAISRSTGVSLATILKMKCGKFDCLYTSKVEKISDYLKATGVRDTNIGD